MLLIAQINYKHKGFTLLEVLIALIIMAISVLGFSQLQVQTIKASTSARFTQSVNGALFGISQRISANSALALNDLYNHGNLADGLALSNITDCTQNTCTEAEFALYDLNDWAVQTALIVPNFRFGVSRVDNLVFVNVTWDEKASGTGVADCNSIRNGDEHMCRSIAIWVN